MNNTFQITFFKNSNGVSVGTLSCAKQPLISTTHPATIAYALQALDADSAEISHQTSSFQLPLPCSMVLQSQLDALGVHDHWIVNLATFSQIDSFNPDKMDFEADIHLRTAIHFLPKELVQRRPLGKAPANWKAALRFRKQFIYYPFC